MTGRTNFEDVGAFHRKFGLDTALARVEVGPREVSDELMQFRLDFLKEELEEFAGAWRQGDIAGQADALVDLVYVALGTAHLLGLPWQEVWDEVQKANMAKKRATAATASERGGTWDVIKPEGWEPPDIAGVLRYWGWPT